MIYGITLDDVEDISDIVEALRALPQKPWVRVVFDPGRGPNGYLPRVKAIAEVAYIVGEILDSSAMKKCALEQYKTRCREYIRVLAPLVSMWEIANEINGSWLGTQAAEKMTAAFEIVRAARHVRCAITLYYEPEKDWAMFRWAENNIPQEMRDRIDWVMVSYYEDDNGGEVADWPMIFRELGELFPAAMLLVGECGTKKDKKKAQLLRTYYSMGAVHERFIGGYFWWYGTQDFVPKSKPLWTVFAELMKP